MTVQYLVRAAQYLVGIVLLKNYGNSTVPGLDSSPRKDSTVSIEDSSVSDYDSTWLGQYITWIGQYSTW